MTWSKLAPLLISFLISVLLIPLIRRIGVKTGRVALPRSDRWHKQPTPTLGGVGIFLAFGSALLISQLIFQAGDPNRWGFLIGATLLFLVGLLDEYRPLSPIAKLVAQILAATIVIALGYTSTFFNPRIADPTLAKLPNILFTYIWLVGITNAVNLLDNMDGLAGGIALITASVLGYFFWRGGNISLLWVSLALAGGVLGFLMFNFPPAKIFMGDSGSLFLGFTLAALAIAQQQQASNALAVIAVPTLIFMLPILDTGLVTITRLMSGQSPMQGGRDHTSHRLVAFGLSERQALIVLYGVSLGSAVMAAALESINYWLSLVFVPILVLSLTLMAAYLGRMKIVARPPARRSAQAIERLMTNLTYRQRIPEVILDFFLIGITYYLAVLVSSSMQMNPRRLDDFLSSLPVVLASTFLILFLSGVYRVVWRYEDLDDILSYLQAAFGAGALLAATVFVLSSIQLADWVEGYSLWTIGVYMFFLFVGLVVTRSSFRILDLFIQRRIRPKDLPVLIVGAGDVGDLTLRWLLMNPQLNYRPVGFIDPDPLLHGRTIRGIKVLGGLNELPAILDQNHVVGLIVAAASHDLEWMETISQVCQRNNCWVRRLNLELQRIC